MSDSRRKKAKIGRLAILGAGKMGETLLTALLAAGIVKNQRVTATAKQHGERLVELGERFQVAVTHDNAAAVAASDVILLCVKPQAVPAVVEEIRDVLDGQKLLLSIVAGLTTRRLEEWIGKEVPVVRAMPNTPSRVGCGMTAVCGGRWATPEQVELADAVFASLGRSLVLDEKYFDAVTGLSASGPAFIYIVIEAMAEGGVKVGLPRKEATELAAQTCLGAAQMVIETGYHPALLKDEVTTPAGCTIDGILKLEEGGLRVTLIKAIVEACRRARELVDA